MPGKHILFISSWYPNRNQPSHGIFNRYFAEACSELNQISILHVCSEENLTSEIEMTETDEGAIRTVIVYYRKITSGTPILSQLRKKKMLLRCFEAGFEKIKEKYGMPDLIQLNVVMPNGLGAYQLSKKHQIPYVVNENWTGYMPEDGNYRGFLQQHFTRRIIAGARAILPVSEDLKQAMLAHGLIGNYRIIPNVVNCELFMPQQTAVATAPSFLHISSLDDAQKNVSGIIRAFAAVHKQHQDAVLNIVGEGKDAASLKMLVSELDLKQQVRFLGRRTGQELVKILNENAALVMFSNYETFSLVVAEAFACGKPVIISDAGGLSSHLSPERGYLVRKRDEKALAEAMLDFLKNRHVFDPLKIRNYAVTHFSKAVVGRQFDEVYVQVLASRRQ